jgi:hypothetical protein
MFSEEDIVYLEYCGLNEYEDFLKQCQHWLLEKELPNDDGEFEDATS